MLEEKPPACNKTLPSSSGLRTLQGIWTEPHILTWHLRRLV